MFQGRIDAITSSGYIEGWAFNQSAPLRPLTVSIRAGGKQIAHGLANRFRWDLADAGCGTGWCAFRLRLTAATTGSRRRTLSLWDLTERTEIHQATSPPLAEDHEPGFAELEEIIAADPTVVHSIDQLRACGPAFTQFIAAQGIEQFVRAAYVYILGRSADPTGLALYTAHLRDTSLSPYEMLKALYDSDEFRFTSRHLLAPPEPGFVFHSP